MKHLALISYFLFAVAAINAQVNLVPNPSFEDTLQCPDFPGQVWRATGWYVAKESPDYFHSCCNTTFPVCGVPNNAWTIRHAATGVSYCGIFTYLAYPPPEYREDIGAQLLSPTVIGTRYYVSMKISSVNSHNQVCNGANSKIGMLFSTVKYDLSNLPPHNNFSQFHYDSIITDTVGWTTIKGSFIADSVYSFITIGNFFDNAHTDTIRYWYINGNNDLANYYFVDDICVSTDSIGCNFANTISEQKVKEDFLCYPIPASEQLTIEFNSITAESIQLYNLMGELVYSSTNQNKIMKIPIMNFKSGIYFLQINTDKKTYSKKVSIINN